MEKRPDYPNPYCPLTSEIISRIKSDQDVWDREHLDEVEEMKKNGEIN